MTWWPAVADALPELTCGPVFSAYVHVPFCRLRCGYCDFNTYTSTTLGPGATPADYHSTVLAEIGAVATELGGTPELSTVFFGGGTPTFLQSAQLANILGSLELAFGIAPGAEVTTEANPETVDERYLAELKAAGFTRVSVGMQSSVSHVLATLDRLHRPERVPLVIDWARRAGLDTSLDLIYGTPGESLDDWRDSLQAAIDIRPTHISAYGLGIEPGTKMGAQVARGVLPPTDPDDQADKYEIADELLTQAGYRWYEVSNWALPGHEARHNLHYWKNDDWWGFGPGAHSHVGGVRLWNVKHPRAYAQHLGVPDPLQGPDPMLAVADYEVLTPDQRTDEDLMLGIRLAEGIDLNLGVEGGHQERRQAATQLASDGLIEPETLEHGRLVLTLRGRLLAGVVIRALVEAR